MGLEKKQIIKNVSDNETVTAFNSRTYNNTSNLDR